MSRKAILIGAGKIGRGFIGQVLYNSGYELIFVDASKELVDCINEYKEYKVVVIGAYEKEYIIRNITAFLSSEERAAEEILEAEIITTAVGPSVLCQTADYIARGIIKRFEAGIRKPLTVIACENIEFGSSKLYQSVKPLLSRQQLEYCNKYVSFPDAEVSRMVIPIEDKNPLTVKVEQYMEWIVDGTKLTADLRHVQGLQPTDKPAAYIMRKIYTLTGHAMLGYFGYVKGYEYIYQAAFDDEIFTRVYKALTECGKGWSREYGICEDEFGEYITVMLRRFSDIRLKDPCVRICREPLRKLSRDERFIGPALMALKHNIIPTGIVKGIKEVFKFDYAQDAQAVKLQEILKSRGMEGVLKEVCGLSEKDYLFKMIATFDVKTETKC